LAYKRALVLVDALVFCHVAVREEAFLTDLAFKRLDSNVNFKMVVQLSVRHEHLAASVADKLLLTKMDLLVFFDSADLQEALVAVAALVRALASVYSPVCFQV
jgi:hypothetical protein